MLYYSESSFQKVLRDRNFCESIFFLYQSLPQLYAYGGNFFMFHLE